MNDSAGNPNDPETRQACFNDAAEEMKEAADSLYHAAKLLVFCSHGYSGKVASLADQIVLEMKRLMSNKNN